MSYRITIERIETETYMTKEWVRTTANPDSPYAYTPENETTRVVTRKVYEQEISNLDIGAIIRAANGMDRQYTTP